MPYTPTECPKCGNALVRNPKGGRPTRWCSEGCKRSGESEMARLDSLLRLFTEGKYVDLINGRHDGRRVTRPCLTCKPGSTTWLAYRPRRPRDGKTLASSRTRSG